jgi:serine/threonine-protein kinase RsbW
MPPTEAYLCTTADLKELAAIRAFIEETAVALKVAPEAIDDLLLAVTEMATNTIVHGYRGEPGIIEIGIRRQDSALIIHLLDQAPPFDPTLIPTPDLTLPLEQRPLGGMGVYLTLQSMDEVTYRMTPQGGNELLLVKKGVA